jgi:uncharacterized membrane protein (DUF4010 family)
VERPAPIVIFNPGLSTASPILNLAVALGIGLIIGAERERRKGEGPSRAAAGIRTFALTSITGAIAHLVGGESGLMFAAAGVATLAAVAHWRSRDDDPGLTTEIALILTVMLGGLAMMRPALAAGVAVTVAILLAARTPLHNFVSSVLSEKEVGDALIFAGATLVVLPLLPNRTFGPFDALNPRAIWTLVVLVMAISAMGYIAVRLVGSRFGLPIAGLASGFISSIATIGAMGVHAKASPQMLSAAAAGAVLSTVATIVQMAIVLAATNIATLQALSTPLISAGAAAVAYGAAFTALALRNKTADSQQSGHAFSIPTALTFALTLSIVTLISAACRDLFGETGVIAAATLAGLVDTHAAAVSIASLVASGKMDAAAAVVPILAGLSTNTLSKLVFAQMSGGRSFAIRVVPGLVLVVIAAWAGAQIVGVKA